MSDQDPDYIKRRRDACLARAEAASDPGIARIHREFAAEYARRLDTESTAQLRIAVSR